MPNLTDLDRTRLLALAEKVPGLRKQCIGHWVVVCDERYKPCAPMVSGEYIGPHLACIPAGVRARQKHGAWCCAGRGWVPAEDLDTVMAVAGRECALSIYSLSTGIWAVNAMSRTYPYGVGDSEGPTRIGPLLRAWCNALGLEVANA